MAEAETNEAPAKGGLSPKTMGIVAGIMVVEAVLVFLIVTMTSPSAQPAEASELVLPENDQERPVEILLVREKFNNLSSGRVWQWDIEVFVEVRQKNQQIVDETLEARRASITAGIARIIARAQDRELKEPGLETITRQLTAFCYEVFGDNPADETPRVERVIIPRFKGFPADF